MEIILSSCTIALQSNESQPTAQQCKKIKERKKKIPVGPLRRSERIKSLHDKKVILLELEDIYSKNGKKSTNKRRRKIESTTKACRLCDGCRQNELPLRRKGNKAIKSKIFLKKPWSRTLLPENRTTAEQALISTTDVRKPEKICGMTKKGDAKYIIVQWKNIEAPEFVKESDMSDELSELLQNFLQEELQIAKQSSSSQHEVKTGTLIANYYRQQLAALTDSAIDHLTFHIKTE